MCGSAAAIIQYMTVCSSAADPTSPNAEASSWIEQHGNRTAKLGYTVVSADGCKSAEFVDDESAFDAELSFVGHGNAHVIEMPLPFGGVAWIILGRVGAA